MLALEVGWCYNKSSLNDTMFSVYNEVIGRFSRIAGARCGRTEPSIGTIMDADVEPQQVRDKKYWSSVSVHQTSSPS